MAQPSYATPVILKLLEPYRLGHLELPNRIIMMPFDMQRPRESPNFADCEILGQTCVRRTDHFGDHAGCARRAGYEATPRIHSTARIEGWRDMTGAVHASGGRIFLQLWHVGKVSHVSLQPGGQFPVAPSAIQANTKTFIGGEFVETPRPRALRLEEIPGVISAFRRGVANAIAAAFDGVELHAAERLPARSIPARRCQSVR
jgi:N-ethylmaleimide reductase